MKEMTAKDKFEKQFLELSLDEFLDLTRRWNEKELNIKIDTLDSYDNALNFFKKLPFNKLKSLAKTAADTIPTESYSALLLWREIVANPTKISKFHKSGLTSANGEKSIVEVAKGDDILATLEAIRNKIAERIDGGSDDMARLTQQLRDITHQIADERRKLGPSKDTELGKLIGEYKNKKRTTGKGARAVSFKSRIMIDDVEQ